MFPLHCCLLLGCVWKRLSLDQRLRVPWAQVHSSVVTLVTPISCLSFSNLCIFIAHKTQKKHTSFISEAFSFGRVVGRFGVIPAAAAAAKSTDTDQRLNTVFSFGAEPLIFSPQAPEWLGKIGRLCREDLVFAGGYGGCSADMGWNRDPRSSCCFVLFVSHFIVCGLSIDPSTLHPAMCPFSAISLKVGQFSLKTHFTKHEIVTNNQSWLSSLKSYWGGPHCCSKPELAIFKEPIWWKPNFSMNDAWPQVHLLHMCKLWKQHILNSLFCDVTKLNAFTFTYLFNLQQFTFTHPQ